MSADDLGTFEDLRGLLWDWALYNFDSHVELFRDIRVPGFATAPFALCVGTEVVWVSYLHMTYPTRLFMNGETITSHKHEVITPVDLWPVVEKGTKGLCHTFIIATNATEVRRSREWYEAQYRLVDLGSVPAMLDEKVSRYIDEFDRNGKFRDAAEQCEAWGGVKLL